jgi:hypothetical protein
MNSLQKALLAGASFAILASAAAEADVGTPVQQTATLAPAPTNLCAQTGAVTTQVTCTVTVGVQSAYITAVYFDVCTNATGSVQNQATFTSTGIQNTPSWQYSVAATADICQHWGDTGGATGVLFKSSAPGTNVVITSPAATTNNSYGIRMYGYLAP